MGEGDVERRIAGDVVELRRAQVGVAVDNALDEVKAVADWVTATNNEDGVAQALDRILAMHAVAL